MEQKKYFSIVNKSLFNAVIFFIVLAGVALRTFAYIRGFDFFFDEAALCVNLEDHTYLGFYEPLGYDQCCPPLFLMLSKFIYNHVGFSEYPLRFFPYICSIFAVFLFCVVSFKIFKSKVAIIFSNFLFCFSQWVITYAMFFKPYMCDVFYAILITLLAWQLKDKQFSKRLLIGLLIFSIFLSMASYPAIVMIFSAIFAILGHKIFKAIKEKQVIEKKTILKSLFCYIIPYVLFISLYFVFHCLPTVTNHILQWFWVDYTEKMFLFREIHLEDFVLFLTADVARVNVVLILYAISLVLTFKNDKFLFFMLNGAVFLSGLLGFLHIYPFSSERTSLYLIPMFILALAKNFDYLKVNNKIVNSIIAIVCIFCMFKFSVISQSIANNYQTFSFYKFVHSKYMAMFRKEKTVSGKRLLDLLSHSDYTKNDYIYCKYSNFLIFRFLDTEQKLNQDNIVHVIKDFPKIPKNAVVYFHTSPEYDFDYPQVEMLIKRDYKVLYTIKGYDNDLIKAVKIR